MEKRIKRLVPLLLIALFVAVFYDQQDVVTVDPEAGRYEPLVSEPQPVRQPRWDVPVSLSRLAVGEIFESLEELEADQQAAGFVRTGYFGKHWPATVTEIGTDDHGISFVRRNGTRHNYTGFDGYRMKVVHLSGPGERETIVVFRAVDKR